MQREHALYAFTKGNLAHSERTGNTLAVVTCDADTFVVLDPGARTFGHFKANAYGVAGTEVRDFFPQFGDLFRLDFCDQVHLMLLL